MAVEQATWRGIWCGGLASAVALWLALPPCDLWPLAWVAPVFWLRAIAAAELPGGRPYLAWWGVGWCFFGATFYWITLPHWSAAIGWVFLAAYFACYLVLFIGLSRVAVHRLRVPLPWAAPIVWTALEYVRAWLFTGFLMAALGHTQFRWLTLIQISDLVGAYGVSFLVMFVAACITMLTLPGGRRKWGWPVAAGAALVATLAYGHFRLDGDSTRPGPRPRIALLQGTYDTQFGGTQKELRARTEKYYEQYVHLSYEALRGASQPDLIVWPESMFPAPRVLADDPSFLPQEWDPNIVQKSQETIEDAARQMQTNLLLAVNTLHFHAAGKTDYYSSSLLVTPGRDREPARIAGRYDKMHPVMFGEYLPLGEFFPWLYKLTPLTGGLTPGTAPQSFRLTGTTEFRFAPTICFETVVPHLMRRQLATLRAAGEEPDVLITQTNDGWFWGSAGLDMHLVCGVFRAIECRKPLLIAANTGISASIDADGAIVERTGKRVAAVLLAEPTFDQRDSPYVTHGDWLAIGCLAATMLFAAVGGWGRYRRNATATFKGAQGV